MERVVRNYSEIPISRQLFRRLSNIEKDTLKQLFVHDSDHENYYLDANKLGVVRYKTILEHLYHTEYLPNPLEDFLHLGEFQRNNTPLVKLFSTYFQDEENLRNFATAIVQDREYFRDLLDTYEMVPVHNSHALPVYNYLVGSGKKSEKLLKKIIAYNKKISALL
jgi:hypothetical protein